MICNKETKHAEKKITAFLSPTLEEYRKVGILNGSVVRLIVRSTKTGRQEHLRWERGFGWHTTGTGKVNNKEQWKPIIG